MSDNLENQVSPDGTGGVPSSSVPSGRTTADSSGGLDLEALSKRVNELDGLVRTLQSGKDKGVQKLTGEVDTLKERLERYEKLRSKGLEPEDALYRMEMEQFLAERRGGSLSTAVPAQGGGGSPTQPALIDHTALLNHLGLDPNSPEVLAVVRQYEGDTARQVISFANLAAQKKVQAQPQPNPAQQVPVGGGSSFVPERTIEDVERDLAELKKKPGNIGSKRHRELVEEHKSMLPRQ